MDLFTDQQIRCNIAHTFRIDTHLDFSLYILVLLGKIPQLPFFDNEFSRVFFQRVLPSSLQMTKMHCVRLKYNIYYSRKKTYLVHLIISSCFLFLQWCDCNVGIGVFIDILQNIRACRFDSQLLLFRVFHGVLEIKA